MRQLSWCSAVTGVLLSIAAGACRAPVPTRVSVSGAPPASITSGTAVAEVESTRAILWARCAGISTLWVTLRREGSDSATTVSSTATPDRDWTTSVDLTDLEPDTAYRYRAWCGTSAPPLEALAGTFRTAPRPTQSAPIRFAWGGDLAGQNVCRDRALGYVVFDALAARHPQFFVALGDMVYADDPCLARGRYGNAQVPGPPAPATDLPGFWSYWKYNRADAAFQRFLSATPYYAVWDDHEVFNDFGPQHDVRPGDPPTHHLLPIGMAAFLDYNPIRNDPAAPTRMYRSVRWGRHLELIILDTRQYRDANAAADTKARPKTMLGSAQRAWLEDTLRRSEATWKVIVTSVPLVVPTGVAKDGRDGWSGVDQPTGFQHELVAILRFIRDHGIRNTLWISTDVHFAAVFRHTPFRDSPAFQFYEVETGPINAGVFPIDKYDRALGSERLFFYPQSGDNTGGFTEALSWFNFGVVAVDANGQLTVEIVTAEGKTLHTFALEPTR